MKTELPEAAENHSPESIIDHALQNAARPCVTCSFQAEDMVVLHLLLKRVPDIPVLFLETGYHFAEIYAYRDHMATLWELNLINVRPQSTVSEQEERWGLLYSTAPGQCCQMRKVEPLMRALEEFDLWFTGLRREQSPTRAHLKKIESHQLPGGKELLKVNPLADWNWAEVLRYVEENGIELLPLYGQGYTSIGCQPCTSAPADPNHPRSGRWSGTKLECGIHTFTKRDAR